MVRVVALLMMLVAAGMAGCADSPTVDAAECHEHEDVPDARDHEEIDRVRVRFETTAGDYVVETDAEHAPLSAANFLEYVDSGFYSCLTYHRVGPEFVVQGGGLYANGTRKDTRDPVPLEATKEEPNIRWSVSMARTSIPDSGTSQFFINVVDNRRALDPRPGSEGYAVFAHVVDGEDTVRAIARAPGEPVDGQTVKPATPIVIIRAYRE